MTAPSLRALIRAAAQVGNMEDDHDLCAAVNYVVAETANPDELDAGNGHIAHIGVCMVRLAAADSERLPPDAPDRALVALVAERLRVALGLLDAHLAATEGDETAEE